MLNVRRASDRGRTRLGWLDSRHTFAFGEYRDPAQTGFRVLRVINDDRVAPGQGFGTHPHRDMEILSYVVEGELEHEDSIGNGSVVRADDVQRMSAGTGVLHSEFNPSDDNPVRFLQIWIVPDRNGLQPGYEQKTFPPASKRGQLRLIASANGRAGSLALHQDASVHACRLGPDERVIHRPEPGRHVWVQVVAGRANLNGGPLEEGDGAALSEEDAIHLVGLEDAEFLLFDLP